MSAELYDRVGHGDIAIKPDVSRFDGDKVAFVDGTTEEVDVVVYATGYNVSLPFLEGVYSTEHNKMPLYLRVVPPDLPGLYFMGFIQTVGSGIPLTEYQAEWVGDLITGEVPMPLARRDAQVDRRRPEGHGKTVRAFRTAHHAGRLLAIHQDHERGPRQGWAVEQDPGAAMSGARGPVHAALFCGRPRRARSSRMRAGVRAV